MSKWSNVARTVVGRGLTVGREKIMIDELIALYPDGIAITGFDFITHKGATFPVFTFKEDATRYFGGGVSLRQIADAWIELAEGDLTAANSGLEAEPCRVKLHKVNLKGGKTYTVVKVLEDD